MRVQNPNNYHNVDSLYKLTDITSLFQPTLAEGTKPETKSSSSSSTPIPHETAASTVPRSEPVPVPPRTDKLEDSALSPEEDLGDETMTKTRNPVRRSNSSPEMSASWKNPFLSRASSLNTGGPNQSGGTGDKELEAGKESRVSCEAIPEEISGNEKSP